MDKLYKGEDPHVKFLLNQIDSSDATYIAYSQEEDAEGITNVEHAKHCVIEATIAYINDNNL